MSACHRHRRFNAKPCPGPGDVPATDPNADPCPAGGPIGDRGGHAQRCQRCAETRDSRLDAQAQRRAKKNRNKAANNRENMKVVCGIKRAGQGKTPMPLHIEPRRAPVKRCKVCMGDADLRAPGREDEYGRPVCWPGSNRCRGCDMPYVPRPEIHARAVLGSSAAMAAGAAQW